MDHFDLDHKYEVGYDLLSKGSDEARRAIFNLFNIHFGFSQETLAKFAVNSAICSGGMRGLKDIADGFILHAKSKYHTHRFIQPDNSYVYTTH